jgi:hypothetical protein
VRTLIVAALTFLAVLIACDRILGRYGARHFLPQQKMDRAAAAGDGCILILGDSRMDAGFDSSAFHEGLRTTGRDHCVAQLAIGATTAAGHYFTVREYISGGRRPLVAVIGMAGDSLLGPQHAVRPDEMVGNQAIHLTWTKASDVFAEVPGFPTTNVATFDAGLRFLMARATSFGRYQSMVSIKTQRLARWLTGQASESVNRFGALDDMARLEEGLRADASARIAREMASPASERLGQWFPWTATLLEHHGVPIVAVELPMPEAYRKSVAELPQTVAYRTWLAGELHRRGGAWIDLSHETWLEDRLFGDPLHLGAQGATRFSQSLGRHLASLLVDAPDATF